tara:strand:+ start:208 stop:546 length:339 start_codon:yes stop_codon:yes gene_type:complete
VSNPDEKSGKFAERLLSAREKRGFSQAELGAKADLQPAAIGHFEKGRRSPSFQNVRKLANALNISADYLLGRTDSMEGATTAFRGEDKLNNDDREFIQMMIENMNRKSEGSK